MSDEKGALVQQALGPGGLIARRLSEFEERPAQTGMAGAVTHALARGEHLLVEAGTGTGKSFAYLVPLIEATQGGRAKAVISTHTINLQEQLMQKDIPFLRSVLGREFVALLVKGRSNYVCLRRLLRAVDIQGTLFGDEERLVGDLSRLREWARSTDDGTKSDLDWQPDRAVWDEVCVERDSCMGRRCPHYAGCFLQAARRRMSNADILVVNHALFFSDLALRQAGYGLLPEYRYVVFDEAHRLEETASRQMGLRISSGQVSYLLGRLYRTGKRGASRGFLVAHWDGDAVNAVEAVREACTRFFDAVRVWRNTAAPGNGRMRAPEPIDDDLTPALMHLAKELIRVNKSLKDEGDRKELSAHINRAHDLVEGVKAFMTQSLDEHVYWVGLEGRRQHLTALHSAPLCVAAELGKCLWYELSSAILTSATLTVGKDQSFDYVKGRLGLSECRDLTLPAVFDYEKQVTLHVPRDLPEPAGSSEYLDRLSDKTLQYVRLTGGRSLVLFTSYRTMNAVQERLAGALGEMGIALYVQGGELPRTKMLERFREDETSVIFGADSFWQGIDVPGPALSTVIVVRLPFSVPDEPLTEARTEAIQASGGKPFMELSVPEAVIRLKQGFGRLIRRQTDRGHVVILDTRIVSKYYGRIFLDSLPTCRRVRD